MRLDLKGTDKPSTVEGFASVPEMISDLLCDTRAAMSKMQSLVLQLITELKGLRKDIRKALNKTEENADLAKSLEKKIDGAIGAIERLQFPPQ